MFLHDYLLACEISTVRTQTLRGHICSAEAEIEKGWPLKTFAKGGSTVVCVQCTVYS